MDDAGTDHSGTLRIGAPARDDAFAKRVGLSPDDLRKVVDSGIFDEQFYLKTYPEVAVSGVDALEHYLVAGRLEGRKPSAIFDPLAYVSANPEAAVVDVDAFLHFARVGRDHDAPLSAAEALWPRPELTRELASGTTRLIVFLTPGFELRSGGVLSIAATFEESKALTELHRSKVAMCTLPGDDPMFLRYNWFENANYLLDLPSLLRHCRSLEYLQLHIPEYAVNQVLPWLKEVSSSLLRGIKEVHINVMVQNIDLVQGQDLGELKVFGRVTATTAHESYSNQETRDVLGVTVHRLSVRFGPELYTVTDYAKKEPILLVSPDVHPLREQVLNVVAAANPSLEICVVRDMAYSDYRALIGRAKWALTFGEGLDGYFAETICSGGNSFAVFNERFFVPAFRELETVYPTWDMLIAKIGDDLKRLDEPAAYERSWRLGYDLLASMYSTDRFRENLGAFFRGDYSFP